MQNHPSKPMSPLLIIFLVVLIDLIGFGLVIPILPYYSKSLGASATTLGLLLSSYSICQFLFAPLWGHLSDRKGRKYVLTITISGGILGYIIMGSTPWVTQWVPQWHNASLILLFTGRILAGFFGANLSVASAAIADVTTPETRTKGMGLIGAAFGVGFVLGPAIGGLASTKFLAAPFWIAAFLGTINLIFCLRSFPKHLKISSETKTINSPESRLQIWLKILSRRDNLAKVCITFFTVTLGFTMLESCFALFLLTNFQITASQAGGMLAYMGIIMAALQGGLIGKISRRYTETTLIRVGTQAMAFSLLLFILTTQHRSYLHILLACSLTLLALGQGLNSPSLLSLASKSARQEERGLVMGWYQSFGSLARILGPIIAGFLYDHGESRYPFVVASVLILSAGWGIKHIHSPSKSPNNLVSI